MKEKLPIILFLLFLFIGSILWSQERKYIYGKIIDSKTEQPLAFASVSIKNKSVGLITNEDGGFRIPSYFKLVTDTLVVSYIGYFSREIRISTLDKDKLNVFKLHEKTESLNEIVVKTRKNLSAQEIVEKAVSGIKKNYPFQRFSYVGYYRDYQKEKDSSTYLNLNEAIMRVHDPGFGYEDYIATDINIYKYEKNLNFPRDTIASQKYDYDNHTKILDNAILSNLGANANEFMLLRFHDAIRNYRINAYDFVNRMDKNFVRNHKFYLASSTSVGNIPLYKIRIVKILEKYLVEGEIFISKGEFKIHKMHYAVFKKKIKETANKRKGYQDRTLLTPEDKGDTIFDVTVEYEDFQNLMYPKYISFNNPFEVFMPAKFYATSAKFAHQKSTVGHVSIRAEIDFNNRVSKEKSNFKKKNYQLLYKGKNIRLDSVNIDLNKVILFPKENDIFFYRKAYLRGDTLPTKDFEIKVKDIKDIMGNEVNKKEMKKYNQFREFFVQELESRAKKPTNQSFMIKTIPIFKEQPIVLPKDFSKYWMNTPLKE